MGHPVGTNLFFWSCMGTNILTIKVTYPVPYSNLLYKLGNDFLDTQYGVPTSSAGLIKPFLFYRRYGIYLITRAKKTGKLL